MRLSVKIPPVVWVNLCTWHTASTEVREKRKWGRMRMGNQDHETEIQLKCQNSEVCVCVRGGSGQVGGASASVERMDTPPSLPPFLYSPSCKPWLVQRRCVCSRVENQHYFCKPERVIPHTGKTKVIIRKTLPICTDWSVWAQGLRWRIELHACVCVCVYVNASVAALE